MTVDNNEICKNCLANNHCDVLLHSSNCNEVRAMVEHDKEVYNKAIDDYLSNNIAPKVYDEIFQWYIHRDEHQLDFHALTSKIDNMYMSLAKQLKGDNNNERKC